MKQYSEAFIGFDTAKKKHAVAIAGVGRESEIRYLGEIDSSPAAVERIIGKLAGRYSMPIHTRPRLAGIGDDLSITRGGTDGLHDSPLEGSGFEL